MPAFFSSSFLAPTYFLHLPLLEEKPGAIPALEM